MDEHAAKRVSRWVREYGPSLLPVARSLAEDSDGAEDLLQEVWMVALRRQHMVAEDGPVRSWLHNVLINVARGRARKRARRLDLLRRWWRPTLGPTPRPASPSLEGEQLRNLLWREIAALPALQRQVVLLRVVEDLSTAEAAAALNRAEGTVKASLFRALNKLEETLGELPVDWSELCDQDRWRTGS